MLTETLNEICLQHWQQPILLYSYWSNEKRIFVLRLETHFESVGNFNRKMKKKSQHISVCVCECECVFRCSFFFQRITTIDRVIAYFCVLNELKTEKCGASELCKPRTYVRHNTNYKPLRITWHVRIFWLALRFNYFCAWCLL